MTRALLLVASLLSFLVPGASEANVTQIASCSASAPNLGIGGYASGPREVSCGARFDLEAPTVIQIEAISQSLFVGAIRVSVRSQTYDQGEVVSGIHLHGSLVAGTAIWTGTLPAGSFIALAHPSIVLPGNVTYLAPSVGTFGARVSLVD